MQSVKIVVTGPAYAGKTTFIKSVSEITVLSAARKISDGSSEGGDETTATMDLGRITISDDVVLYLFGTSGQKRFSSMWETLSEDMQGLIVLVDATVPDSFRDAIAMIDFFNEVSDVPYVVAVNKVTKNDESRLACVRDSLKLDPDIPLFPVDVREKTSVKAILLGLMYRILESVD